MKTNAHGCLEVQWKLHCPKSCVWTSRYGQGVVSRMEDDTHDLIVQLCTRVGMIMEDASLSALTISATDRSAMPDALAELESVAVRISTLVAAAKAVSDGG